MTGAKGTHRRPMLGTCTAHERTYFLSPVLDTGILHCEKRQLDEFSSCRHERSAILVPDTEFYVVESINVLQECATGLWCEPVMKGVKNRTVRSRTDTAETHEMPSSLSAGNDSYASC